MVKHYWVSVTREMQADMLIKANDDVTASQLRNEAEKHTDWPVEWVDSYREASSNVRVATEEDLAKWGVTIDMTKSGGG